MLEKFKGCLLGAAIGDALGMPNESTSPNLNKMKYGYRKPYKGHPNDVLDPGQFTDDTQMMILVGTLLADGKYNEERYATGLRELYNRGALRFPDGSVSAACEHQERENVPQKGVKSTTSGCLPVSIPFALSYPDMNEACERAVRACNVTHTHPAAHAAVSTYVTLLYHALHESPKPIERALEKAQVEDDLLGGKLRNALILEKEGMDTETALLKIGNDVSVFQTLPIAFFLMSRYQHPPDLLTVAANTGGNTDTICLLCGGFIGASKGIEALPADLLEGLEDRQRIELLAQRLHTVYNRRLGQ
ncbi:MAG TPA: ADP-ribosylglycohydrolase family protein [Methanoregula sp.]|nr:ADP-ribosylglycohydrolase family protein [Methanoregula sp.]